MAVIIEDLPQVPEWLLALLAGHLPYSLPTLRRLQFAHRVKGGSSPTTHILLAYDAADSAAGPAPPEPVQFAVAYADPSRGPETECWLYSTIEDSPDSGSPADPACVEQVLALLRRIRKIHAEYVAANESGNNGSNGVAPEAVTVTQLPLHLLRTRPPGHMIFGSVHESVRQAMLSKGVVLRPSIDKPDGADWEFNGKWLFRVEDLPGGPGDRGTELPAGMRWDTVREGGDVALVQSRTIIPRKASTLLLLPSTLIRLDDGTPIAWAFLGLDGSLTSLHCEEPYRGRGLAKALAGRVMRDHLGDFGDDGWCSADVSTRNPQSQGVCKSLRGKLSWLVSWFWVDLATVGEPL